MPQDPSHTKVIYLIVLNSIYLYSPTSVVVDPNAPHESTPSHVRTYFHEVLELSVRNVPTPTRGDSGHQSGPHSRESLICVSCVVHHFLLAEVMFESAKPVSVVFYIGESMQLLVCVEVDAHQDFGDSVFGHLDR